MTSLFDPEKHSAFFGQRSQLLEKLDQCMAACESNRSTAIFLVQARNVHEINALHGYAVGDQALVNLQQRLEESIKKASLIARLDSSSYVIIIEGLKSDKMLPVAAQRIDDLLAEPYAIVEDPIHISCNIGIAYAKAPDSDSQDFLLRAENSIRLAKEKSVPFFFLENGDKQESVVPPLNKRMLDVALADDEFHFNYQPKINLATGTPGTCEALIRWKHPGYGNVPTEEFIAVAEATGLVHQITAWALKSVIRESATLNVNGNPLGVALNISATDLYHQGLLESLDSALSIWGVAPELFTLEVTEGAFIENPEKCFAVLSEVRKRGIRVSIDDFGTGFSSLAYFKHIPADEIKIDKSFILELDKSKEDQAIVAAVISLAHKFNMKVVAEGVENAQSLNILKSLGCDYAQGYHFSRPQRAQGLNRWLDKFNIADYYIVPDAE